MTAPLRWTQLFFKYSKARQNSEILSVNSLGRVLIVAPHPDDEVLGCGGLIARLTGEGNAPHIAILTGGGGSHRGCCQISENEVVKNRRLLTFRAAQVLDMPQRKYHFVDIKDGSIPGEDDGSDEVNNLCELIKDLNPDTIFVPHSGEGWPDHLNAARLIRSLVRELNMTPTLYEYAVWMWYYNVWNLDWKNVFAVELSGNEFDKKCLAVDEYVIPQASCGRPWSGVLPGLFLKANKRTTEIYFKSSL